MVDYKVAHITNSLGMGGTQKSAQLISQNMGENYDISVLSQGVGSRKDILEKSGVDIEVLEGDEMLNRVKESSWDVIHFHGDGFSQELIENAAKNSEVLCKTTNFGWVDISLVDQFDYVFFPSKMTLHRFSKIHSKVYGRNTQKFRLLYYSMNKDTEEGGLSQLEIDDEKKIVGKIGRSAEGKWANITLKGFEKLIEDRNNFQLLLVSPPDKIKNKLQELGIEDSVTLIDAMPPGDVYKFYNTIDVLAHSSGIGESFGYVLAECLNSETPVVVDSNPMRDNAQVELVENGVDGFIANSPEAYAKSLEKAVEEALEPSIKDEIKVSHVVSRLSNLYEESLNEKENNTEEDLRGFSEEYKKKLCGVEDPVPVSYKLEKMCWYISANSPAFRPQIYELLRGFFQPGRKLYKMIGGKLG